MTEGGIDTIERIEERHGLFEIIGYLREGVAHGITVPIDASTFETRNYSDGKHSEKGRTESNCRFTIIATVE